MSHFAQKMAFYSAYHQEPTNIWIHVAGVPTITFSAFVALSTLPLANLNGVVITAASVMYTADTMNQVLSEAVQIHGGTGYIWESEINRLYRAIKLLEIGAGTTEVRKMIIAKELLAS